MWPTAKILWVVLTLVAVLVVFLIAFLVIGLFVNDSTSVGALAGGTLAALVPLYLGDRAYRVIRRQHEAAAKETPTADDGIVGHVLLGVAVTVTAGFMLRALAG